jgi:tetratricopeptide (TPR) repeat protein
MEKQARDLFLAKRYQEAADTYKRLAQTEPSQPKWCTNGAKCFYKLAKHAKAVKLCKQATTIDPTWERGYECHAQALIAMGEYSKAVQVRVDDRC